MLISPIGAVASIVFLSFLVISANCSADGDDSYVAAVFEYFPIKISLNATREEGIAVMLKNMQVYETQVITAKQQGAQIIVFPEFGLYGDEMQKRSDMYPYLEVIPEAGFNACMNSSVHLSLPVTTAASCMAWKYGIYIVLDMADEQPCWRYPDAECPSDGHFQFNTQLALDPQGTIIGKYHKTHLFQGEDSYFDASPDPDALVTFDTDFGIRFGMFICFDIFFKNPEVIEHSTLNVTDFVFSSYWVNTAILPLMSAVEIQQGWTRATGANLLASNIGNTWVDSGSGIYSAGKYLEYYYNYGGTKDHKLLVATVPKKKQKSQSYIAKSGAGHDVSVEYQEEPTVTPFRVYPGASGVLKASSGTFECSLSYQVSEKLNQNDTYALFAYAGKLCSELLPSRTCALIHCPNANCTDIVMEASACFSNFTLSANYEASDVVIPMVGTNNGQLLQDDMFTTTQGSLEVSQWDSIPLLNAVLFAHGD